MLVVGRRGRVSLEPLPSVFRLVLAPNSLLYPYSAGRLDWISALGAAAALIATLRYKVGLISLLGVAAAAGLTLRLAGLA